MLKVWNMILVALAFNLSLFGTFLTRSGVLNSIHSFSKSSIGGWFLAFLALMVFFSIALIRWRLPLLRTKTKLESLVSREATFLYNNLMLVALCLTILWGVLYPILSQAVRGDQEPAAEQDRERGVDPAGGRDQGQRAGDHDPRIDDDLPRDLDGRLDDREHRDACGHVVVAGHLFLVHLRQRIAVGVFARGQGDVGQVVAGRAVLVHVPAGEHGDLVHRSQQAPRPAPLLDAADPTGHPRPRAAGRRTPLAAAPGHGHVAGARRGKRQSCGSIGGFSPALPQRHQRDTTTTGAWDGTRGTPGRRHEHWTGKGA